MKDDPESWDKWGIHVLEELKRLNANVHELNVNFQKDKVKVWSEISKLNIKSGAYGVVGGALVMLPAVIFYLIKN